MRRGVPSVPRPTGRGAGVAGVSVVLVALSIGTGTIELVPLTVAVGLPLLLAPAGAWIRGRRARARLAVDASVSPPLAPVGGEVTLRIGVTNRSGGRAPALAVEAPGRRWQRRSAVADGGGGGVGGRASSLLVPPGLITLTAPAPRRRGVFVGPVASGRRGVFVLPASSTWVLDGFGLFGARGPVLPAACAVLYPVAGGDVPWPAPAGHGRPSSGSAAPAGHGRDGPGELVGIRPYVTGDRLSLLHWPARARYRAWYVRQFGPHEDAPRRLVLDDRAGVHRRADFEEMVAGAQGLVERCWRQGETVELGTLSGSSATLAPAPAGVEEARVLLAAVLPRPTRTGAVVGPGTVITTATGARSLPDGVDRIVVGG